MDASNHCDCGDGDALSETSDSSFSDDSCDLSYTKELELRSRLRQHFIETNTPLSTADRLLHILHSYHPTLPLRASTLLAAASLHAAPTQTSKGEMVYFSISSYLRNCNNIHCDSELSLTLHVDGLPLFKSSSKNFWPILGKFAEHRPFVIGVHCGYGKPDLHEFLCPLISELQILKDTGIQLQSRACVKVNVHKVICDSPARAFVKATKYHSGYSSCDKCTCAGEWHNKVVFLDNDSTLRSNDTFRRQTDENHHNGISPFLALDIDMVDQFPFDYMHSVCLGAMRKMILAWMSGSYAVRLSSQSTTVISNRLSSLANYFPSEFNRRPRGLETLKHWKATEFRSFLLYTGPVVLRDVLNDDVYKHFLILHVAISILCSHPTPTLITYCGNILKYFVQTAPQLYGTGFLSYNIHSLVHLHMDCCSFGSLDNFSAFEFENYLGYLKRRIRSGYKPLQQIVSRINETYINCNSSEDNRPTLQHSHADGPLPPRLSMGSFSQYKRCCWKSLHFISSKYGDSFFYADDSIHRLYNVVKNNDGHVMLITRKFTRKKDFFDYPVASSEVFIFCVSENDLSAEYCLISLDVVTAKLCALPFDSNHLILFRLVHQ